MQKNISSKKTLKPTKKAPVKSEKKGKTSSSPSSPFRYGTWLKCIAMLLGIAGVCLLLLGTYGTFRAIIHQAKMHETVSQDSADYVPPRAADGSRPTSQPNSQQGKQPDKQSAKQASSPSNSSSQQEPSSQQDSSSQQADAQTVREALDLAQALDTTESSGSFTPKDKQGAKTAKEPLLSQALDPNQAKMVIVIDDIGESLADVRALLNLDFPITFAIWPHATHTKKAAMMAYSEGAEVILHQPMQPLDKAANPGKGALYVGMSEQEIRATVQANLALVPNVVGLNNHMGSLFTQDASIRTVCEVLQERRLFALDSVTHGKTIFYTEAQKMGLPSARRNVFLDAVTGEANVLYELGRAEKIAKEKGLGIAIGHPFATTISGLQKWSKTRDKNIAIVRLRDIVH